MYFFLGLLIAVCFALSQIQECFAVDSSECYGSLNTAAKTLSSKKKLVLKVLLSEIGSL